MVPMIDEFQEIELGIQIWWDRKAHLEERDHGGGVQLKRLASLGHRELFAIVALRRWCLIMTESTWPSFRRLTD